MLVRDILKKKGMTTKELAEKMDMSVSGLNQHLAGNPTLKVLHSLADALQVPVWRLFATPEEIKDSTTSIFAAMVRKGSQMYYAGSLIELETLVVRLKEEDVQG